MKKNFLFVLMCMMASFVMAAPGESQAEALPYNFGDGAKLVEGTIWYEVNMSGLSGMTAPVLSVTLDNSTAIEQMTVDAKVVVESTAGDPVLTESKTFTLKKGDVKNMSTGMISMFKSGYNVYLCLKGYDIVVNVPEQTVDPEADAAAIEEKLEGIAADPANPTQAELDAAMEAVKDDKTAAAEAAIKEAALNNDLFEANVDENKNSGITCGDGKEIRYDESNIYEKETGGEQWYIVDLRAAKAKHEGKLQDVAIEVENLVATANNFEVIIAPECPCQNYEETTRTIAAHETVSKLLSNAMINSLGDIIYVRVKATGKYDIRVFLQDAEVEQPGYQANDVCSQVKPTILDLADVVAHPVTIEAGYYKVALAGIKASNDVYTVKAKNLGTAATDVTVELGTDCADFIAERTETRTIAAGAAISREISKAMLGLYKNAAYLYIHVETDQTLEISATKVTPENGCANPENLVWSYRAGEGIDEDLTNKWNNNPAGEHWYKLALAPAKGKGIDIFVENLTAASNKVKVELFEDCMAAAMESRTQTIAANGSLHKDMGSLLSGVKLDYIYLHIVADGAYRVKADIYGGTDIIEVCDQTVEAVTDVVYTLNAEGDQWYVVDVKNLKRNTEGDGMLQITNQGAATATVKAELVWACETTEVPATKTQTLAPNAVFEHEISRNLLINLDETKKYAYLHITTDQKITFVVSFNDLPDPDVCHYVNTNVDGFATFSAAEATIVPAGVTLYRAASADLAAEEVHLISIDGLDILPANTGVLVRGAQGQYAFCPAAEAGDPSAIGDNLFVATPVITPISSVVAGKLPYVLANKNIGTAFYPFEGTKFGAHKAHLELSTAAPAAVRMVFRRVATDVESVEEAELDANAPIYTITGMRVANMNEAGVYIQNGQKFVVVK